MDASAYIVGPLDGPGAAVRDIAHDIGFMAVLAWRGLAAAEQQAQQTPICFFLFATVHDVATLQPVAQQIRFCTSRRIRFSPLIYFAESASAATIKACVHMGFDDIITLPFTRERVMERLTRQLDAPKAFYETSGYFGPDRRGRLPGELAPTAQRNGSGGHHRRIDIVRSLKTGITVLKDDTHAAA